MVETYTRNTPSFLLFDEFSAHRTDDVLQYCKDINVQTLFIPGGFTSSFQPLDVCVNKPLKGFLREEWSNWWATSVPDFTVMEIGESRLI